ncbi:hypothetical protein E0485_18255 [Paenibacillus albiflavus]|uniref:3D domain-containing protein n=2 Tax=Paenibacillus albiflavus TaxID=2545760 RepID=A0A4R4E6N4_9BACL|nr:hypothetical protein E0485_18255 [Paenibacillus albiflavus]
MVGTTTRDYYPVNVSNDIISEKVDVTPETHCMELFMSMYLKDLDVLRVAATEMAEPVTVAASASAVVEAAVTKKEEPATKAKQSTSSAPAKKSSPKSSTSKKPEQGSNASGNTVKTPSGTFSYSKMLSMTASAYSGDASENGGWAGVDYFGNSLKLGTVAVDPNVIPLKSKLFIVGYSYTGMPINGMMAVASDVGGAIKGNKIDIFLPGSMSYVQQFGLQNVKVYVLK